MKPTLWIYALLGLAGCALSALLAEWIWPPNKATQPAQDPVAIVLLIDASGSMTEDGKLDEVKRAASDFVERTDLTSTEIGVVAFGSEALTMTPLSRDRGQILQAIDQITEIGATMMNLGIAEAIRVLSTSTTLKQSVLLFTDGEPSAGVNILGQSAYPDDVVVGWTEQEAASARSNGVQMVAVGTEDANSSFLGGLTNNPDLVFSTTSGNFGQAFQQAQVAINSLFGANASTREEALLDTVARSGLGAVGLALLLMLGQNLLTLRGKWYRDLVWVVPAAGAMGAVAGSVGQGVSFLLGGSLIPGWAVLGSGTGLLLGLADRSLPKAWRGMAGGLVGGLIGGLVFGLIASSGAGVARVAGFAVMGAAIGLMVQLAQEAFKSAWIVGISLGPYEGKEYILAKPVVSVGRADSADVALVNEPDLAQQAGLLRQQPEGWVWEGQPIQVNGAPYAGTPLQSGDRLRLGGTDFQFQSKGAATGASGKPLLGRPWGLRSNAENFTLPNPLKEATLGARGTIVIAGLQPLHARLKAGSSEDTLRLTALALPCRVNGAELAVGKTLEVKAGDLIQLGDVELGLYRVRQ